MAHFTIAMPGMAVILFGGLVVLAWFATNVGEKPNDRSGFNVVWMVLLVAVIGYLAYYPLAGFIARLLLLFR